MRSDASDDPTCGAADGPVDDDDGQVARALAVAAWRRGADDGLAAIAGPDAARARALVARWRAAGAAGARAAAATAAALAAPRPAGWRAIDPSWIEAALAGERAAVRAAVRDDDGPVGRWCARWLLGGFAPMPTGPIAAAPGPRDLARLPAPALAQALAWLGRRQLVHALGAGGERALAPLAAAPPWGRELTAEIAAVAALGDDASGRLGPRRVVLARASGLPRGEALAPVRLGARAIAATVAAHADLAAQLAQRLPRAVGLALAAELAGDHGPAIAAVELTAAVRRVATPQR